MKNTVRLLTLLALATGLLVVPSAGAAIQQQAIVKLLPASGSGAPKGKTYVKVDAYLSTRDAESPRDGIIHKPNPVGRVDMTFPAGTTMNPKATAGCTLKVNAAPAKLKTTCAASKVGDGWALVSNLGLNPLGQLSAAPPACAADDATQYSRTYENAAPACTPRGFIWAQVSAYQGGLTRGATVKNMNSIIFANNNQIAPLSFNGLVTGNKLIVQLPALNGSNSQPGELPLGAVLVDFKLNITKTNYLKMGACPANKKAPVSSKITFSRYGKETGSTAPAAQTLVTANSCKA